MKSIILTKHAVNLDGTVPSEEWIQSRAIWLERLTIPSLNAQTAKDFVWCPLVDQSLLEQEARRFSDFPIDGFDLKLIGIKGRFEASKISIALARQEIIEPNQVITTTILDSDDALVPEFIASMRELAEDIDVFPTILDFQYGLVLDRRSDIVLKRRYYASCFQTLVEVVRQPETVLTVMARGHHLLPEFIRYRVADTRTPMWIMNVHGGNLANRARGLPRRVESLPEDLQHLLEIPKSSFVKRVFYFCRMITEYVLFAAREGSYAARLRSFARNVGTL